MDSKTPKQALATRAAYEALIEPKKMVDDAASLTHAAELESFHVAISHDQNDQVVISLQSVIERVTGSDFERAVFVVRDNWKPRYLFRAGRGGSIGLR